MRSTRAAALLLILGLAVPAGEHVYWMLGGTRWLHRSVGGHIEQSTTKGIQVVAAVVVVLLVAAALVTLARAGLWRQAFVSDRLIRFFAWALAAVFLMETLANFTWSREYEWKVYGPVALVIGALALVVARSRAEASA
jgi:sulfite exporter TauE/SafE